MAKGRGGEAGCGWVWFTSPRVAPAKARAPRLGTPRDPAGAEGLPESNPDLQLKNLCCSVLCVICPLAPLGLWSTNSLAS